MRGASLTLLRVRGIPIRAHWTLLLVIPYLAVVLSIQFAQVAALAGVPREQLVMPPLAWGILLALGLFASVAIHEIMHTVLALRFGGSVRAITLMLLGGVSELTRAPRRARDEALMAGVGPVTSLALGGLLLLLFRAAPGTFPDVRLALFYLGYMNVAIGLFNLLPAFPMDGGRVLRAALVAPFGAARATQVAASVGRALAVVMGLAGVWTGNLMLVLIAVFVFAGAGAEQASLRVRAALEGLRVMDLAPAMAGPPPVIEADASLSAALARMREQHRVELVVADEDGAPLAIVTAQDLVRLGAGEQHTRRLSDVRAGLPTSFAVVPADASASAAIAEATESGSAFLVVMAGAVAEVAAGRGRVVALVTPSDIEAAVLLRTAERRAASAATGARGGTQPPLPTR